MYVLQTLVSSSVCRTYMQTCSDLLLSMVPENDSVLVKLYMILAPVGPPVLAKRTSYNKAARRISGARFPFLARERLAREVPPGQFAQGHTSNRSSHNTVLVGPFSSAWSPPSNMQTWSSAAALPLRQSPLRLAHLLQRQVRRSTFGRGGCGRGARGQLPAVR